ncbi:DUF1672 family protein [Neobacillus mesonae]|uniref:DUF1672 family protein n=1 Tax=Neobacillus mesonae TaxID=1193713 RepID=UPI002E1FF280|nr:DUF1672 family protein [Neobacillus mesonae]
MKYGKTMMALAIGMSLILGGCGKMNISDNNTETESKTPNNKEESNVRLENYVRVQDYTGEGYKLENGEKTDKIAKTHRKEIDQAVKDFFLKNYKTKVIVHNAVGNVDGATVFVESVGEPHFHAYAIIPIDTKNKKIMSENVWSQEGQIEDAIATGIYAMIFDEEFKKLDQYVGSFVKEHPVVGRRIEAVNNTDTGGFSTPYYYTTSKGELCDFLFDKYMENPKRSNEEWKTLFDKKSLDPKDQIITIEFFMAEKDTEPDPAVLNQLVADIEKGDGIPPGAYSVLLNDNTLDKTTGINSKDSTLERAYPNFIIKK